jgi:hypothetical protein
MKNVLLLSGLLVWSLGTALHTRAQVTPFPAVISNASGVYIDPDGRLQARQVDDKNELAAQRLRAKALAKPPANGDVTYLSLGKLLGEVRSHVEAKRELPDAVRYLSGITQLRYVFVFPDEHDLVIAGTSEPFDATNRLQPTGKVTGRPVMHLDDLVTALRMSARGPSRMFGCSIDPHPDSLERSGQVVRDLAGATRAARMNGLKEALGPQQIRVFGAPADSRLVFITIAADYKMKRMSLGLDPIPVAGIGLPVDNSRPAGNRFWFELDYAPLLVSPDSDAYELRGQRLTIKAGALSFDTKGATETSKRWAKNFAAKMPQLAVTVPLYADLQNVADLSVVAALIRRDRLDAKAGLDLSWIMSEANYRPTPVPTPRTAETLVNYTSGSLVAGGVTLDPSAVVAAANHESDREGVLKTVRGRPGSDNWWTTRAGDEPKPKAR